MCPASCSRNSTWIGRSLVRVSTTCSDSGDAFEKLTRYLMAKLSDTGSCRSTTVCCPFLSACGLWRTVMLAVPMSPVAANLMPSLATLMLTFSPMADRSFTRRWNSAEGILTCALYSLSGMPSCSWSISISFISKSATRAWSGASNMRVSLSPSSSAFIVRVSSLPMHLSTAARLFRLRPIDLGLSQRKCSNPSALSSTEMRHTWLVSMA
mmetsp:Transcript_30942/g.78974  ORF Transcript_30942/g.78974 Transcript_30942/m.78974 type:complete len:210 (-) Transcript_30942:146-775(-)